MNIDYSALKNPSQTVGVGLGGASPMAHEVDLAILEQAVVVFNRWTILLQQETLFVESYLYEPIEHLAGVVSSTPDEQ